MTWSVLLLTMLSTMSFRAFRMATEFPTTACRSSLCMPDKSSEVKETCDDCAARTTNQQELLLLSRLMHGKVALSSEEAVVVGSTRKWSSGSPAKSFELALPSSLTAPLLQHITSLHSHNTKSSPSR